MTLCFKNYNISDNLTSITEKVIRCSKIRSHFSADCYKYPVISLATQENSKTRKQAHRMGIVAKYLRIGFMLAFYRHLQMLDHRPRQFPAHCYTIIMP